MNVFFFPLFGILQPEPLRVFRCNNRLPDKPFSDVFSCQLLLPRQGRICGKCTSKRRERARQPTFAPYKTSVGDGRKVEKRGRKGRYKGIMTFRKGGRHIKGRACPLRHGGITVCHHAQPYTAKEGVPNPNVLTHILFCLELWNCQAATSSV